MKYVDSDDQLPKDPAFQKWANSVEGRSSPDGGVRITGIDIPFRDMVLLILQIFFASLVAGIVILPIAFILGSLFGGL